MKIREITQANELAILHPSACHSNKSRGRLKPLTDDDIRTCFQRDRDRIIHSKSFRRLMHKTQVFLAPYGDHYRTRLSHVLEVSQIARTIARALRLNEDLTEAVALGHDLGHTPFGHAGEAVLKELHPDGFDHYIQSLRVVDLLENNGTGLNLTYEVREGIVKHSKGKGIIVPTDGNEAGTLEGQTVRLSDIIAYLNHDLDDALRAKVISLEDIPPHIASVIGNEYSMRINTLVSDLIYSTIDNGMAKLVFSKKIMETIYGLRNFLFERVYENPAIINECDKAKRILKDLYNFYLKNIEQVPIRTEEDTDDMNMRHTRVSDFIAGMTDRFALHIYRKIFVPRRWPAL